MFDEEKLKRIILQYVKMVNEEKFIFSDDLSFEEALGLDSLEMVEIIVGIEEQFQIEFNYEYLVDALHDYGSLKKYVYSMCTNEKSEEKK